MKIVLSLEPRTQDSSSSTFTSGVSRFALEIEDTHHSENGKIIKYLHTKTPFQSNGAETSIHYNPGPQNRNLTEGQRFGFAYDFGVAVAVLASALKRGIHPTENIQNCGRSRR
jgi:hypothetical protein